MNEKQQEVWDLGRANARIASLEAELDEMRAKWAIADGEAKKAEEAVARHSKLSWDATQAADRMITAAKRIISEAESRQTEEYPCSYSWVIGDLQKLVKDGQRL